MGTAARRGAYCSQRSRRLLRVTDCATHFCMSSSEPQALSPWQPSGAISVTMRESHKGGYHVLLQLFRALRPAEPQVLPRKKNSVLQYSGSVAIEVAAVVCERKG